MYCCVCVSIIVLFFNCCCCLWLLAPDVELDRFDKAIGHVFDVEAKAQMLIERYAAHRNVEFYHVCLEQLLTSPTAPTDLLSFIGLSIFFFFFFVDFQINIYLLLIL